MATSQSAYVPNPIFSEARATRHEQNRIPVINSVIGKLRALKPYVLFVWAGLFVVLGFLAKLIVDKLAGAAWDAAQNPIQHVADEIMSSLPLSFVITILIMIFGLLSFWIGRVSARWSGWDYILYGAPLTDDDRMSIPELKRVAERGSAFQTGWSQNEIYFDLEEGLSDAVASGIVTLWGKQLAYAGDGHRLHKYSHFVIEKDHLREHHLSLFQSLWTGDPLEACTRRRDNIHASGVVDLRVTGREAVKWLRTEANKWRGRHDAREAAREKAHQRWLFELDEDTRRRIDDVP